MKNRNFLLDFALKSKYNLFASITALLVLLFAISTVTYAWIEGATTLSIQDNNTGTVYSNTNKAVKVTADSAVTNTIDLAPYLDPVLGSGKFYLAPHAVGTLTNGNNGLVNVKINGRDADANDISTNYIFFETKIKCSGLVTDLLFDTSSYINIGGTSGTAASYIKTGLTLLNASDRTPVYSNIYSAEQIKSGVNAVSGFAQDGEYILQFKIWNEGDENYYSGSEVSINLLLKPQIDTTTLKLIDYTNSETSQNLLSSKTVKLEYNGGSIAATKSGNTYTFEYVPCSQLDNIKFVAYESSSDDAAIYASYDLTETSVEKGSTYTVYGDHAQSLGTFGVVQKVTLKDVSYENLVKSGTTIKLSNGVDEASYTMYRGSSTKTFTAYVPASSIGKAVTFSNSGYTASGTLTASNPYYYIFGETMTKSGTKTVCAGKWYASDSQTTTTIEIQDKTKGRLVQTNAHNVYVQYSDLGSDFYKAYYDSTDSRWKITATNNSLVVWSFEAYSDSAKMYNWTSEARTDADTCFYFITAETTGNSDGSWNYTGSDIDPGILTGEKVSFYGGIANNWSPSGVYISSTSTTSATQAIAGTKKADDTFYQFSNLPSGKPNDLTTFVTAKFINVDPLQYYLKHKTDWEGKQIEDEKAEGGKFYGVWSIDDKHNYIHPVDAVTGKTTIGSASEATSSTSPAKISTADANNLTFSTVTSSKTSLLGENLYVEYHVSTDGTSFDCVKMMDSAKPISSTTTTTDIDLSGYIDADTTLIVKTVLTDGQVYYVSDTDYIKFADTKTVRLSPSAGATISATYGGTTYTVAPTGTARDITVYSGETLTITATQTATSGKAKFTWNDDSSAGTQSPASTELTNTSTYTLPITSESPSLTTLSVSVDQYYKLSYSGGITSTTATDTYVQSGKTVDLKFSHATNNYKVVWKVGTTTVKTTDQLLAGETDTYPVTMNADKSVTVILTQLYKLTYSLASGSASGSALTAKNGTTSLSSSPQYFENGTVISFTATKPDADNYYSITWKTTDDSGTSTSSDGDMKSESETKNITVNGNTTVEVTVTKSTTYAVTINKPTNASLTAEYTVNGVTCTISDINTSGATVNLPEGATVKVTATKHDGYQVDGFEVKTGSTTETKTGSELNITVGTDPIVITVNTSAAAERIIYLYDVAGTFSSTNKPKIWYWKADSNNENSTSLSSNHFEWANRPEMTLVDGYSNIWSYTLTADTHDCSEANWFIFGDSGNKYCSDISLNMYNNKTGTWSTFPPSTTEYTVTVTSNPDATITVKRNDTNATVASGDKVPANTSITVTVTPNTNYNVTSITVGSSASTYTTSGTQTKTATVTGNVTVSAEVELVTKRIYFDTSDAGWFNEANAYPAISYSGHTDFIYLGNQTETIGSITYYYCDVPTNVSGITLRRQTAGGDKWNPASISNPTASQNVFKIANGWIDANPNGTWSVLDTSGGEEASIWYLRGNLNGSDVSSNQDAFNFKTTSDPNVFTLTYKFTGDNAGMQYVQMHNGTSTYAPTSGNYQNVAENTESNAGSQDGIEKWGIAASNGTTVTITWNASTNKIKWVKS